MEHPGALERLARIAADHHGVFSTEHARISGLTDQQAYRRIESGQWRMLHRNVYRWTATPDTWEGDLLAACWAGGFRAMASHRSAAALWGLPGGRRDLIEISCPRWRRTRHDRLIVHETNALGGEDVDLHRRIPVSSVERTLLDLGAVCSPLTVKMALDSAEHRGLTTHKDIRRTLKRLGRQGRPGVRHLRTALSDAQERRAVPESAMESLLLDVLRRHGLPVPVPQYEIHDRSGRFVARVDAAYPEARIAIEYDSMQEHTGEEALQRDNARRNSVVRAGYMPVTARYRDLKNGGHDLCTTVASVLASLPRGMREEVTPKRGVGRG